MMSTEIRTYDDLMRSFDGVYFKNRKKAMFDIYFTIKKFYISGNIMFMDEFTKTTVFYYYIRLPQLKNVFIMVFDEELGYVYKVRDDIMDSFTPST